MQLLELIEDYLISLQVVEAKSEHTVKAYRYNLLKFGGYLYHVHRKSAFEEIVAEDLWEYFDLLSYLDKRSLNQHLSAWKSFCAFVGRKYQLSLPFNEHLRGFRTARKLPVYLTTDELAVFMGETELLDSLIYEFLYGLGLRVSELLGIRLSMLHLEEERIYITGKNQKTRLLFLYPKLITKIRLYLREYYYNIPHQHDYLLVNRHGKRCSRFMVYQMIKRKVQEYGLNPQISPHSFRHSFATSLLNNEMHLPAISKLLGHSDLSTTEIYTHVETEQLKVNYFKFHPRAKK